MRIAIVGYGKMGRMIREKALLMGHSISAIIDPIVDLPEVTDKSLSVYALEDSDVVIDFSSPKGVVDNIIFYSHCGVPAVIGTTGWLDQLPFIESMTEGDPTSIMYSGNFSIGVAVFLKTVVAISSLMDKLDDYDVAITETHHTAKLDSPSGTAVMIANEVMKNLSRKTRPLYGNSEERIAPEELQVSSVRVGKVPGIHEVVFDSAYDTITLTHSARSREGFATGAIRAASWLIGRRGIFNMDDFLEDFLKGEDND